MYVSTLGEFEKLIKILQTVDSRGFLGIIEDSEESFYIKIPNQGVLALFECLSHYYVTVAKQLTQAHPQQTLPELLSLMRTILLELHDHKYPINGNTLYHIMGAIELLSRQVTFSDHGMLQIIRSKFESKESTHIYSTFFTREIPQVHPDENAENIVIRVTAQQSYCIIDACLGKFLHFDNIRMQQEDYAEANDETLLPSYYLVLLIQEILVNQPVHNGVVKSRIELTQSAIAKLESTLFTISIERN